MQAPPRAVGSAEELLAIAYAMEHEAGRRYGELAARMRAQGEERLAALFEFLSEVEGKHADQVAARALAIMGKPPDPALVKWELPERFDDADASSSLLTPYRALAIAVRNEDRAFAFFSYLAASAPDDRIREMAEHCAKDELDHAALLRRERRKSWRREGGQDSARSRAARVQSLADLLREAQAMERAAADGHRALAATLSAGGDSAVAALFEAAAADEAALADELKAESAGAPLAAPPRDRPRTLRDGLQLLEYAFEYYSEVAEAGASEAVLTRAQVLEERALRRLTRLRGSLAGEHDAG